MLLETALYIVCGLGCFFWCATFLRITYSLANVAHLRHLSPPAPALWPKLSILVTACNEQDTIKAALTTLLALDYPNLEFVLVNDRSTDRTGQLMDELTVGRGDVTVVHIHDLPSGWIGKTHALNVAAQRASGDWLLFTDADIHFSRDALQKAMAHVLAENADHLAMLPAILSGPFWLRVVIRTFTGLFITRFKVEKLRHASNSAFVGSGSFNLVNKKALDKTPGLEWLKMDVVDDVGLGLMLHGSGAKSLFAIAGLAVQVEWYPDLPAMFKGLAKNTFGSVAHYSVLRTIGMTLASLVFLISPILAISLPGAPVWLQLSGLACVATLLGCALTHKIREPGESLGLSILMPAGMFILSLISIYSMIVCLRNKGVVWRGTHYGLDELRHNQRLKL